MFIIDVKTGRIAGSLSLITRTVILSIPGDLLNAIDRSTSAICEYSKGLKLYWLVTRCFLGTKTGFERS